MEWISAKDRLPESWNEKKETYIVSDGEYVLKSTAYFCEEEWRSLENNNKVIVTHWQSLPELPKTT